MDVLFAFLLTLFAGLATGIGSIFAFNKKIKKETLLSFALGLSAGVMIYVSFVEIFPKALESLSQIYATETAYLFTTLSFFFGIALIAFIDYIIPEKSNPHELHDELDEKGKKDSLMRLGMFSAIAIAVHNFPEGLATFIGALEDPALGISIAIAIAIHNIPEGIAVAVPIFHATNSKKKAVGLTLLSGLAEPLGAVVGFVLLRSIFTDATFGFLFAAVAGIMVYISLDELLPSAEKYGKHHLSITGLILGMIIMAVSLILF
ncbi:MAG: zinc transporter ZupT [Tenericutes bacterium HGW-Tenericutes-5]|jgi:ZIP family zinc transporter|nr:MAG: zinc transporter ZupT [Tenericutes bacterium HGW-Tenericutes-5]